MKFSNAGLLFCVLAGGFLVFSMSRAVMLKIRSGPRVDITPSQVDLGTVQVGQEVRQTLMLRKAGNARLLVTDVRPTCPCVRVELAERALMPGDTEQVIAVFKASSPGAKQQQVLVQTNDVQEPVVVLAFLANAISPSQLHGVGSSALAAQEKP
jgi:hypothetical protein